MLSTEQKEKAWRSLKKVSQIEIFMIRRRIQNSCILNAKTNEAKLRLVNIAIESTIEDMNRLYGVTFKVKDKKYYSKIIWKKIKEFLNV